MHFILTNFAATASEAEGGLLKTLGIDWGMLGLQVLAFLILLWFLGKFVYPPIVRMLDKRDEAIEASAKAAQEAQASAENSGAEVERLLKEARREAGEIVSSAKDEAASMVEAADEKAKARAERIVADAREQIDKDVLSARQALRNDAMSLVTLATEKVLGKTVDAKVDESIVKSAVKEAK